MDCLYDLVAASCDPVWEGAMMGENHYEDEISVYYDLELTNPKLPKDARIEPLKDDDINPFFNSTHKVTAKAIEWAALGKDFLCSTEF